MCPQVLIAVSYYFDKAEYANRELDFDPSMCVIDEPVALYSTHLIAPLALGCSWLLLVI